MRKISINEDIVKLIIDDYSINKLSSNELNIKYKVPKKRIFKLLKENNVIIRKSGRQYKGGKSESDKRYYEKNKLKRSKYLSKWRENNKEYLKEYTNNWKKENKSKINEQRRFYEKNKKNNNPTYKLIACFRTAIYKVLKENNLTKYGHYFEILGYQPEDLIIHLEKQFINGMTWENYGEWHVDHIKPISLFNFTDINDDEFKKCWSLDNLQPLWAKENLLKSNKYEEKDF